MLGIYSRASWQLSFPCRNASMLVCLAVDSGYILNIQKHPISYACCFLVSVTSIIWCRRIAVWCPNREGWRDQAQQAVKAAATSRSEAKYDESTRVHWGKPWRRAMHIGVVSHAPPPPPPAKFCKSRSVSSCSICSSFLTHPHISSPVPKNVPEVYQT
jgi:hypothetical protein